MPTKSSCNTIAIIIPFHITDSLDDLSSLLHSINSQTSLPDELLICVNGSVLPPDSVSRVNSLIANFPRLYFSRILTNAIPSVAAALNVCIQHSSSKWLMRIDADDTMLHTRVQHTRDFLSIQDSEPVLIYSPVYTCNGFAPSGPWKTPPERLLPLFLSLKNPIHHVSVTISRANVIKAGLYRSIPRVEDYDLWLRLFKLHKDLPHSGFVRLNSCQVLYNISPRPGKQTMNLSSSLTLASYQLSHLQLSPLPAVTALFATFFLPFRAAKLAISYSLRKESKNSVH